MKKDQPVKANCKSEDRVVGKLVRSQNKWSEMPFVGPGVEEVTEALLVDRDSQGSDEFLTLLAAHRTDAAVVDVALPAMPQFMMETNAVRTAASGTSTLCSIASASARARRW